MKRPEPMLWTVGIIIALVAIAGYVGLLAVAYRFVRRLIAG